MWGGEIPDNSIWSFAFIDDSNFTKLSEIAKEERWDNRTDPARKALPILRNYVDHTYRRLVQMQKEADDNRYIFRSASVECFNTGLFTPYYEAIYALFVPNTPGYNVKWRLVGFFKESESCLHSIGRLPERARYFRDINELVYDTRYDLRINMEHILGDPENKQRIPERYRDEKMLPLLLKGTAIEFAKRRIEENYRAAIPQYFNNRVQFLIPLSFGDPQIVDLALAVSRDEEIYTGRTCLTLDMAYNNARLIARPESDWL